MDRREFLKRTMLAAAYPFISSYGEPPEVPVVDYPNILLVITDDQPFRSMSEMPQTTAALSQGVEMTKAYLTTPQCGPSRATIMTGRYVRNHKCLTNDHTTRDFKRQVRDDGTVNPYDHIAYHLSGQGYRCGLFGKWLNHYDEMPGYIPPGYDEWRCTFRSRNGLRANMNGKIGRPNTTSARETGFLTQKCIEFMQRTQAEGAPFFAILSFNSPHSPYTPTQASRDVYAGMPIWRGVPPPNYDHYDSSKPAFVEKATRDPLTNTQKTNLAQEWRAKMAEQRDVDNVLGPLLNALNYDDTYAFYLTDNSYLLGEHRLYAKNMPYEESARTPMFARGPGFMQNATSDLLCANVDLAPTFYELAGLDEIADQCDGRSLAGALVGPWDGEASLEWRDALMLERYENLTGASADIPGWKGVRTQDYLYAEWAGGGRELYDMVNDPYQLTNVVDSPEHGEGLVRAQARLVATSSTELTGGALRSAEV